MKRFLVCLGFVVSMPLCAMHDVVTTNVGQVIHYKYGDGTVIYNVHPNTVGGEDHLACYSFSCESPVSPKKFICEKFNRSEIKEVEFHDAFNQSELIFNIVEFEYLLATSPTTQQNGIYKLVHGTKTFYFTKEDEQTVCGSFDTKVSTNRSDILYAFVYRTNLSVFTAGTLAYDHVFSTLQKEYNKNPALTF
jgi:hypothetical protein